MEGLIVYKEPMSSMAEAYRILCTNILAMTGENKILEVVGVANASNVSNVIANLGIALAQAGKKVLIIDCNLRNPKQHELFGLANRGVTDYVSSGGCYTDFVQETRQENLFVLVAGATAENPVEILLSKAMQNLLQFAKETYEVILIDVPPVVVSDTIALGSKTDCALLVLTNKQDKVEQVQKAKEMLNHAGVTVLGCILDKA